MYIKVIIMKSSNQRIDKIARNINAMDLNYDYIDQHSKWIFWHNLRSKLFRIIKTLSESDKTALVLICKENKAQYFGLI